MSTISALSSGGECSSIVDSDAEGVVVSVEEADAHHDDEGHAIEDEYDETCFIFGDA